MRVKYNSSLGNGYAIAKDGESRLEAVGRSIARKNGYHYYGARLDSWDSAGEFKTYELTLTERLSRGYGDAVPFRNVWCTIYK
jgi:hypothetical protein